MERAGKKGLLLSKKKYVYQKNFKKIRTENNQKTIYSKCREHVSTNVNSLR